jgi:hypothetical protein
LTAFGERFLSHPELFPARLSGESWGDGRALLQLPGGPFLVRGINDEQRASLVDRFGELASPPSDAEGFVIDVFRAAPSDFREIDTRGWEYALDFEGDSLAGMRLMARLGADRAAIWTSVTAVNELWSMVENVLRPLVARRLLASGGLLLHSAAVSVGGRGVVFAGPSGAGKSTIASLALAAGHPVLSDDLNALMPDGDGFTLMPLPFTGDLERAQVSSEPAPLRAIVRLEKGDAEALRPMPRGEAVALLVRSAPYVNRDSERAALLFERAQEVARRAATSVLTFRRGGDPWPILFPA